MNEITPTKKIRVGRRAIGVAIAVAPFLASISCALYSTPVFPHLQNVGLGLALVALALGCINFFLSFVRPQIHQRLEKAENAHRNISGIPIVGTVLQITGVVVGFGNPLIGGIGTLAAVIDTGGAPWFVTCTWKDHSFWDS